jgi:transcriptional regulator
VHTSSDPQVVRQLVDANPWGVLISAAAGELVASHAPILVDDATSELAIVTHVGRPDDEIHGLGETEMLLIVQGHHGYISPSWYAPGATRAPTWNYSVAHCYGVPELLEEEENLRVLTRLVDHFERHVEEPMSLDPTYGAQLARGTVGIRLPIARFLCKLKLSQDKDPDTRRQIIAALRGPGPYRHPELATDTERAASSVLASTALGMPPSPTSPSAR